MKTAFFPCGCWITRTMDDREEVIDIHICKEHLLTMLGMTSLEDIADALLAWLTQDQGGFQRVESTGEGPPAQPSTAA